MQSVRNVGFVLVPAAAQLSAARRNIDAIFTRSSILHAGKYMSLTSLYLFQPLRPGRIPVVLIHGLIDTPMTWVESVVELIRHSEIQRGYQIWSFAYPTNLPFLYSATLLRRSLVETMDRLNEQGRHPNHDRVVLIGHSMGGLLTRIQITDSGSALWDAVFTEPPERLDITQGDRETPASTRRRAAGDRGLDVRPRLLRTRPALGVYAADD